MKIITISGHAQNGKDFCANLIKQKLETRGEKVLIAHYADLLKYICKTFFGWDGQKNIEGRTLLQYVGTDVIRQKNPDYWINFLIGIINLFPDEWDYVIIPDTRFPNENDLMKEYFDVTTVRITRPNFDNGLTEEQQNHESETALDNYGFDFYIVNNGDSSINGEIDRLINNMILNNEV